MKRFRLPDLKIFIPIIIINLILFILVWISYSRINNEGYLEEQRNEIAALSMEITSKISQQKSLLSTLSGIDFLKNINQKEIKKNYHDLFLQIETMKKSIGSEVVFLLDPIGDVILSSTYIGDKTLAGNNAFRPYFKKAVTGEVNFYGAIGDLTESRGFYFAAPVKMNERVQFVMVAKFPMSEIDDIFRRFASYGGLVTPDGVIFSSNRKKWIMRSLYRLDDITLKKIRDTKQFSGRKIGDPLFNDIDDKTLSGNGKVSLIIDRSAPGGWALFSIREKRVSGFPLFIFPLFLLIIVFELLVYSTFYNLRKRREAQRRFDESSGRFRYLFQSALDSIFILDSKGIIIDLNYAALLKFGYLKKDLIGKHFRRIVDKKSLSVIDKHAAIIEDELDTRFVFRAVTGSKKKILLDCSVVLLKNRYGEKASYFAFCHDITRQRKFENELKKAIRDAKRANRAKSEFLANMSHEIRTPMNAILGFTEILKNSKLVKEQKNYLHIIDESGKSLIQIIDDILDFSRIEAGKIHFENVGMDLRKISNDVINIINIGMNKGKIPIRLEIDDDIPEIVKGDPLRLKQVFINLLSNAVKFTEKGEVILDIKVRNDMGQWISIQFSVIDTGIGIHPDDKDKLFEPFSQIDSSSSRKYRGTGLGLVITSGLVEKMGGEIRVESIPGKGSEFIFVLSFEKGDIEKQRKLIEIDRDETGWSFKPEEKKILIAEDQNVNSMLLDYILKREGFKTKIAENGEEALKLAKSGDFDLILMDIQMPKMDGIQAAQEIRKLWGKKNIPIIALTADAMKGDRERFISSGMDDYLEKPINKKELFTTIRKWILGK